METKKISFGFTKTKKQEKPAVVETKEYIDCVEEKSIKVIGGELVKDETPLVIPMKPNTLITAERLKEIAEKVESALDEESPVVKNEAVEGGPPENETLEQMATRELLQEAKQKKVVEKPLLLVPLPAKPVIEGEKESTLNDYESVPIQDFGLAMLRGMGWSPGQEQSKYKQPALRPKGLGLGADKVVKDNQKKQTAKDKEEELAIVKGSHVKVTTGKYNGHYGKVVSLDEDNGRVMVDITVKKETVSLSEFMVQVVSKSEFDKRSKLINADSYAQYKRNESESLKFPKHQHSNDSREGTSKYKANEGNNQGITRERERKKDARDEERYPNGKNKDNKERLKNQHSRSNSTSDEEMLHRYRRKDTKEYSSEESVNSDFDKKSHNRKKRKSSGSSSDTSESDRRKHKNKSKQKRDIDKKRKGKKKKRDRDRSPNYRKHKK